MAQPTPEHDPSSFRDPSGFIFFDNDQVYRYIAPLYVKTYRELKDSGVYQELFEKELLVSHQEVHKKFPDGLVIQPEQIPFISYPYEWSFSQLKDAALLTLEIQKLCLSHNFSLKDASAYNIQFLGGKPIFIDTLSFEPYKEGSPWVAYRQFCQHFLAPLVLMAEVDVSFGQLSRLHLDGIPLNLASKLLPGRTRLSLGLLTHIHLHAKSQTRHQSTASRIPQTGALSKTALLGLIDNLESSIKNLKLRPQKTEWEHYYTFTNYTDQAEESKKEIIRTFLTQAKPQSVWDLGANTGKYSRLASEQGIFTVASDIDPLAVEYSYRSLKKNKEEHILPLILDLTNPSPDQGWANQERNAFFKRHKPDLVMVLALVHHLAISNNVPLEQIAALLQSLSPYLIIEFVPKEDSQVKKLLATREDIFPSYTQDGFEEAFKKYFTIAKQKTVQDSARTLYLMCRK